MTPDPPFSPVSTGGRDAFGRFASGPLNTGRPRNSRNAISRAALQAVQDLSSAAIAVLRQRLAENDLNAARIVIETILPKGRTIDFGDDISPSTIEAALAEGTVTPAEAHTAAATLEKLHNVRDVADLVARVCELEAALAAKNAR